MTNFLVLELELEEAGILFPTNYCAFPQRTWIHKAKMKHKLPLSSSSQALGGKERTASPVLHHRGLGLLFFTTWGRIKGDEEVHSLPISPLVEKGISWMLCGVLSTYGTPWDQS